MDSDGLEHRRKAVVILTGSEGVDTLLGKAQGATALLVRRINGGYQGTGVTRNAGAGSPLVVGAPARIAGGIPSSVVTLRPSEASCGRSGGLMPSEVWHLCEASRSVLRETIPTKVTNPSAVVVRC